MGKTQKSRIASAARKRKRGIQIPLTSGPQGPYTTKAEFVKALKGTAGILYKIAENLKVQRTTVKALLSRPDWGDIREEYEEEKATGIDRAEETIQEAITQRHDLVTAANTAKWYLTKIKRETYGDETKITHAGRVHTAVSLDQIPGVPLEVQKAVLEAAERARDAAKAKREASGVYE